VEANTRACGAGGCSNAVQGSYGVSVLKNIYRELRNFSRFVRF
jgi:hypothetical protein